MKIVKPFMIHLFYRFLINLIKQILIIFILTIVIHYLKIYYLCIKVIVNSIHKFKNGI